MKPLMSLYFDFKSALRCSGLPELTQAEREAFAARALRVQAQAVGKVMAAAVEFSRRSK